MIYGSVCSGIEAATVAWEPLGWKPSFFSEIEAFPRAVLQHHYPNVPLHGDFTTIKENEYEPIQILVGGTPCQSFSIAGLRGGLDDDRGNLALEFLRLADRTRPRWLVWENVPGVLSSNGGRDFGSIVGGMVQLGYGIAYRILDAQYFGVAQRRRRVFVVGYLGDWRRAAAVLFERQSLSGNFAPSRETGKETAICTKDGPGEKRWPTLISPTLNSCFGDKQGLEDQNALNGGGLFVPDYVNALTSHNGARNEVSDIANGCVVELTEARQRIRRLTPRECERLQGFPDDYTLVPNRGKPAADGPRYKALGNSMAVPVMRWIGRRIDTIERLYQQPTP
jgi:DNA (cytosine-5)-methyltransferase 1